MATVVRENVGLLNDKLSVQLTKEDYLPAFNKKLKEYSKTANIPGFRKGMVPVGMIKKMYGAGIFNEEVIRTVERELYNWLDKERPDIFAQPLPMAENRLSDLDMNNPQDVKFDFEIGLKPEFTLADLSKAKLTRHKVEVTPAMLDEEIERMQNKGGNLVDQETVSNEENVLNILFTETQKDGEPIADATGKENSVLLKYFTGKLQKELKGKKVGESVVTQLNKAFEGDKLEMILADLNLDKEDKASAEKYFKLDIAKIGLVEKRALDEGFFNEIFPGKNIKTEAELRDALQVEIAQYWDAQSRNQLQDQIYHYLLDETKMEFPEAFLTRWLETGSEEPKTAEQAKAEYPNFSNQLKWTLISDKIINENKLEVSPQELREYMGAEITRYFGQMNMGSDMSWLDSYIDRMMKDEKQVDATYRRLITEKVFGLMESQSKPSEKTVTAEELTAMQHHHEH